MKDERVPLKIVLQNFINHVENLEARLKENDDLYESEFQELKNISDSLKSQKYYACTEGEKSVNRRKNRYKDILPFDVSRVVLSEFPGVAGSDYINANYIRGASGSPAYIASQGPLPHTVADFWRMAVECEVQVIVMACNQTEAGKHKCEHYVPEVEDVEQMFGDVAVTLSQSRQVCPDFTVKKLTVRYTGASGNREERLVCQFHYSAWPDHGVPSSVVPLLHMIRMLRDTQASETLPVLVHCSAGCGRTGTICAIDYVWGLLKAGKLTPTFSLFDLVAEMRRQRIAMVQTKDQYMLVHRAVRQLFADQLRVIESHPYANVDGAGKVLTASATAAGDGDYEEICLAVEAPPPAQDRSGPSPPPRHRKSIPPRQRPRPPPLPHKRKAAQPEPEPPPPLPAGGTGSEPEYRGSLDRAETGRRASVGRLRQVFETGEPEPAAAARPRLSRSRSSAALRCPPPGAPTNRPRTGSVSAPRDRQLVLYVPPPPPAALNIPAPNARTRSPVPARPISRVKSPVQKARAPPPPDVPVHSQACAAPRARSPPQVRPVARTRTSPLPGGAGNSVPPPDVRIVVRTSSPSARAAAGRPAPPTDRRPVLPIKRSKSLKMPAAPLRAQRLGPAYLALENPPSRGGPAPPVRSVALPERSSAIFNERSAAGFGERNSALPERSSAVFSERNSAMLSERSSAGFGERSSAGFGERSSAGLGERNSVMLSERSAGLAERTERSAPPPVAVSRTAQPARAVPRPLYVNVTPPPAQRSPPADSPPRYVNIDLLREYEEELVQRSRELGLNDTLTEETGLASPALVAHAISPHNGSGGGGGGGDAPGRGSRYGNVPPSPPPPLGEQPLPTANYPNCTPQVRQNLNRIETELQRNQRSGFYDTSGEPASLSVSVSTSAAAAVSRVPPSSLGWHARERRNSFRQAVQGGETSRGGQYERIWVGDDRSSPTVPAPPPEQKPPQQQPPPLSQQLQPQQPRGQPQSVPSAPSELENRVGGPPPPPPRPFVPPPVRPPVSGSDPGRPSVVPVSSFIVQGVGGGGGGGGGGSSGDPGGAGSPLLVGNSLFWPDMLGRRGEPDPAAVTPPLHKTTANSVFYSDTPSPPGRSTSLSVSENSAFKPYLAEKASSPNFTAYKQAEGDTPPWPGLPPGRTTTGMPNSASPPRGAQPSGAPRPADAVDRRPVAPPRKRASSGALLSRLSVSQPQLVGPSHLFLADADLDLACDGPERGSGADGDGADSDTDSLPPAVPEKTQAAYQVPTPVRDVLQQEQQQSLPLPLPPPLPPQQQQPESLGGAVSSSGGGGSGGLGRSLSLRPCDRAESAEPRPLNRALGRLQATASSLRSRLGGRTEPQERTPPPPPPAPPAPERTQQVNEHSRQAYI